MDTNCGCLLGLLFWEFWPLDKCQEPLTQHLSVTSQMTGSLASRHILSNWVPGKKPYYPWWSNTLSGPYTYDVKLYKKICHRKYPYLMSLYHQGRQSNKWTATCLQLWGWIQTKQTMVSTVVPKLCFLITKSLPIR
jgi:hypothetical protein